MSLGEEVSLVGATVWIPDESEAWTKATVSSADDKNYIVKRLDGYSNNISIAKGDVRVCHFSHQAHNASEMEEEQQNFETVQDLTTLTQLHEPSLLEALCQRFAKNRIYTNTGPILLALNPFQNIQGLYTSDVLYNYYTQGLLLSQNIAVEKGKELPPHIYKIADQAYRAMFEASMEFEYEETEGDLEKDIGLNESKISAGLNNQNQSILVSGESGAGKTESTKHIMNYLASVANQNEVEKNSKKSSGDAHVNSVAEMVLKSNPILESFGNARTVRNDNSSRFGKFIEMQFNEAGKLVGARIKTYLLEKVRINKQSLNERNYHIFYQVMKGADAALRKKLRIDEVGLTLKTCNLTNQSDCYSRKDGVKDEILFKQMLEAMEVMKFSGDEVEGILGVISGLMHLANVEFIPLNVDGNEGSKLVTSEDNHNRINITAGLLGLTIENADIFTVVEKSLTKKKRIVNKEVFENVLNPNDASAARDAVIRTVYSRMFEWIVQRVNSSIEFHYKASSPGSAQSESLFAALEAESDELSFIGVLDIFGFEVFMFNGLNQLLINLCNEALMHQFSTYIFKLEQMEYEKEQIEWTFLTFPDNTKVLRLIDGKPIGVLSLLDEQCLFPNGNDEKFSRKLYENLETKEVNDEGKPLFEASRKDKVEYKFCVNHYAGFVRYDTTGFCDTNKDQLFQEALDLMQTSNHWLLSKLFPPGETADSKSSIQAVTVGTQFKSQLADLLTVIKATHPHYVRCLKPNDDNVKIKINRMRLFDQLRYGGVLEAVKVARAGYPIRMPLADFIKRYKLLAATAKIDYSSPDKKSVHALVEAFHLRRIDDYQVGLTKVFLKKTVYEKLEQHRTYVRTTAAVVIQKMIRGWIYRKRFILIQRAVISIQCFIRQVSARRYVRELRKQASIILLQKSFRRFSARNNFIKQQRAAITLQKNTRMLLAKKLLRLQKEFKSMLVVQTFMRCSLQRMKYLRLRAAIIKLQGSYRSRAAKRLLRELRREAKEVGNLQSKLDEFKAKIQSLTNELQAEKERSSTLEQQISEMRVSSQVVQDTSLIQQTSFQEQHNTSFLKELNELRIELDSERQAKILANTEISVLQQQLEAAEDELERIRENAHQKSMPNGQPTSLIQHSVATNSQTNIEIEEIQLEKLSLSQEVRELKEELLLAQKKILVLEARPKTTSFDSAPAPIESNHSLSVSVHSTKEEEADDALVELSKRLSELEAENMNLKELLDAKPSVIRHAESEQRTSESNGDSYPSKLDLKTHPQQTAASEKKSNASSPFARQIEDLESALTDMGQENKDYKRANYELQEKISSYITKMCDAENRANELEESLQKVLEENRALIETKNMLASEAEVYQKKVDAMEVLTEQASGVKIALAKRLEELLVEKKKIQSQNKKLKDKLQFTADTNKELQFELSSYKKKLRTVTMPTAAPTGSPQVSSQELNSLN